jgi:hypothetical protein
MKVQKYWLLFLWLALFLAVIGLTADQESMDGQTLLLKNKKDMPEASIENVSWIAGHWRGELFGGVVEEIWSPPFGGAMMGMFKHVVDGEITFYEFMTIVQESGSLVLKLKHFDSDMTAWESKKKTINFPLVKITQEAVFFDAYTFQRIDANTIQCYLRTQRKGREMTEVDWIFRRVVKD